MKTGRFCAPALGLLLATLPARADAPTDDTSLGDNAALRYWIGAAVVPNDADDVNSIRDWQTIPLDDNAAKVIDDCKRSLIYLHLGAEHAHCDWGLDFSQGRDLLLPFLNKNRELAQVACLRSRQEFQQNKPAAAIEDLCDALTCARHTGLDGILICKLVQYQMESWSIDTLARGLKAADADALKQLKKRLDDLPGDDLLADVMNGEKRLDIEWTIRHVKDAGPNPDWESTLSFLSNGEAQLTKDQLLDFVTSAGGTSDAVIQKLQELAGFIDQIARLIGQNLPVDEFDKQYQALRGQYDSNPFAAPLLSDCRRPYEDAVIAQTRLIMLRAAIAVVQGGPDALKNFHDPIEHQPFQYNARSHGFALTSTLIDRDRPLKLVVGTQD